MIQFRANDARPARVLIIKYLKLVSNVLGVYLHVIWSVKFELLCSDKHLKIQRTEKVMQCKCLYKI